MKFILINRSFLNIDNSFFQNDYFIVHFNVASGSREITTFELPSNIKQFNCCLITFIFCKAIRALYCHSECSKLMGKDQPPLHSPFYCRLFLYQVNLSDLQQSSLLPKVYHFSYMGLAPRTTNPYR